MIQAAGEGWCLTMTLLSPLYALVAALALCALCGGGGGGARAQDIPAGSVAGVALTVPDLSILVDAAVAADVVGALSDPTSEFTVFAPSDIAFVALLGALGAEGLDDLPVALVTEILLYHVVPAVMFSTDLTDGMVLPTLGGGDLTVDLTDGVVIDGVGSSAAVVVPDVVAGSSVVHVIDTVLLPFVLGASAAAPELEMEEFSIAGVASTGPPGFDLSMFAEAFMAREFVGGVVREVNDIDRSLPTFKFTVFWPTNDAFVALLGALGTEDLSVALVTEILLYHVVPGRVLSRDLTDGMKLRTLGGGELTVDRSNGVVIDGVGSSASVVFPDAPAQVSIVHMIDTVLLPS